MTGELKKKIMKYGEKQDWNIIFGLSALVNKFEADLTKYMTVIFIRGPLINESKAIWYLFRTLL